MKRGQRVLDGGAALVDLRHGGELHGSKPSIEHVLLGVAAGLAALGNVLEERDGFVCQRAVRRTLALGRILELLDLAAGLLRLDLGVGDLFRRFVLLGAE